jgi:hypothetical protein
MSASGFDENAYCRYSCLMKVAWLPLIALLSAFLALLSCSFDYNGAGSSGPAVPELLLTEVEASRYENARLSMVLSAGVLEMYDADRIWAGENVHFIQYSRDGKGTLEAEGSAGLLLVDDASDVYTLGDQISFHLVSDNLFIRADELRWAKKTQQLAGPADGDVSVEEKDGSMISGAGFFADTLARKYEFRKPVSGVLVSDGSASEAE